MDQLLDDIRFAWQRMRRRRLVFFVIITTFGLSLATAVTVASLLHAALLRPLPLRAADDLVWIWNARTDRDKAFFSVADWIDFRDRQRSLTGFAAVTNWGANQTGLGEPERVQGVRATANLFQVLGAHPAVGRLIQASDGSANSAPVVVVTWSYWMRKLAEDPHALGRTLTLGGEPYVLIGVLPRDFPTRLPGTDADAEVFATLLPDTDARRADRDNNFLRGIGRLRQGGSLEEARRDFARIQSDLRREYPDTNQKKVAPRLLPLRDEIVGDLKGLLLLLAGAVALMGLLACLNIASLQLAEGLSRDREIAIRIALGARSGRLIQLLLTESLLMTACGGVLGLLLAPMTLAATLRLAPPAAVPAGTIHLSASVVLLALAITTVAGAAFGLLPARRALSLELESTLREGGRGATASRRRFRILRAIVALEIALAFLFLLAAGLFATSLNNATHIDPGFRPAGVLTARLSVQPERYPDLVTFMRFWDALSVALQALPGVQAAALTNVVPLSGMNVRRDFTIVGRAPLSKTDIPGAQIRYVSEQYFKALQIRILEGSDFGTRARLDSRPVALIDQALAHRFFSQDAAVGKRLDTEGVIWEIVGVVANVKHDKLDDPPTPTLYLPLGQMPADNMGFLANRFSLVVRTSLDPTALTLPLKRALHAVDPDVPAAIIKPLNEWVADALAPRRLVAVLIALFGVASTGLAVLGVYGLIAQSVAERTQEIGIRIVLGAMPHQILRATLMDGIRLTIAGLVAGVIGAWAFGRLTRHFLVGITATDPGMSVAAFVLMLFVAMLACAVPAYRAARLNPMVALRAGGM